jgi:hypothetical protein
MNKFTMRNKPSFIHYWILGLLLVSVAAESAEFHGRQLPDQLQRFGTRYELAGCGLREFIFLDIYLLSVYLPAGTPLSGQIDNRDIGKVFLLDVLYDGNMPDDLPNLWREPLADEISAELLAILQDQYDRVQTDDRVEFGYYPGFGEELRINEEPVLREPGRELMPALIELWLGDDPVSNNLRRLLISGDCED